MGVLLLPGTALRGDECMRPFQNADPVTRSFYIGHKCVKIEVRRKCEERLGMCPAHNSLVEVAGH